MLRYRVKGVVVCVALVQVLWCLVWGWICVRGDLAPESGLAGAPAGADWEHALGRFRLLIFPWAAGIVLEAAWRGRGRMAGGAESWAGALQRTFLPALCAGLQHAVSPGAFQNLLSGSGFWAGIVGGICFLHRALPGLLRRLFFSQPHRQRAVLLGSGPGVGEVAAALRSYQKVGVAPVGWVGNGADSHGETGVPWLGAYEELDEILEKHDAKQVVVVDGPRVEDAARRALEVCQTRGVRLLAARTACSGLGLPVHWESGPEVDFGSVLREPLQCPWNRFAKRGLDLLVAVPAVILAVIPLACALWVVMRFQSKGPVFHRQMRHGRDNRPFRIWKFRTMHCGGFAEARQACRGDPRIFPLGAWLRRHSLDELPQFINVLIGNMSTVGPRPHLVEHTEIFGRSDRYHWRSYVKPGITGLAQIHGCRGEVRSPEDVRRRVHWDIEYVEHWSLFLDVRVIFKTAGAVLDPPETAF
jgi:exopolysaccharide biosynthesis polyprenyl glycosylphosphotransferase